MQDVTEKFIYPEHTGVARFMAACERRETDATPVWFMRQGGSSFPAYREILAKYDVMTIAKTPELSSSVALIPVNELGVDAAVLYADIMLPVEEMGIELHLEPNIGPIIHNPIRSLRDVESLRLPGTDEVTPFVMGGIRLLRQELEGKRAVIGIAGAPFTLACYMIEGRPSRDYHTAKALMYSQPEIWHQLMDKISTVIAGYLVAQVRAGVNAVQVFDSWIGSISPSTYREYVLPYTQRVFSAVKLAGAPAIHFGTGTSSLLGVMAEAGGDVMSVDWRVDLDIAWKQIGYERGLQGNLDPTLMLTEWPVIEEAARDVLRRANNRPGHIFNFGHAMPIGSDPDLLRRLVDTVHELTQR
ncbi:uroporphyrinogen decarboxylase [Ktedonospora formicarum]|uniref:Uroporphyrinogen decarboxylase n=1 Tax=Ktedonospora formicarum TaxID=2778364 RepID=A0A8J3I316_9CHLR|nr:uroporphyrinogen decarboxylase [Ktedonospora formicarum]GHO43959.1 uroporphyrinogen decarboxylase [Ktedonospora formicarum]